MRIAAKYGLRPSYAIYEAGCVRLGAATAAAMPKVPVAIYRFMFSDEFCFGFPPKSHYLDSYLLLLDDVDRGAPWMVAGLGVDIRPLIVPAVARGGHIRVGLEDRPWGVHETNRALVEEAVRVVRAASGEPASPADVRATSPQLMRRVQTASQCKSGQSLSRHDLNLHWDDDSDC